MFNKIDKDCTYCKYGHIMMNEEHVACKVMGLTDRRFKCRHFVYDPLKRIPTPISVPTDFSAEDFAIE